MAMAAETTVVEAEEIVPLGAISPAEVHLPGVFVQRILVEKLGIVALSVGDDFHFGKGRAGNYEMLQTNGTRYDYKVKSTASLRQ